MSTLVTVATDGFRDFVSLPDGRTFNMGSVSVLKLITTLVPSGALCRQALDAFLKDKHTTISADLTSLEKLLQPKRSRWAGHENRLIPPDPRNHPRGASTMNPDQAQAQAIQNQVAAIETHIALLEQTAKEHAAGSQSQQQVANSIETLKKLVGDLAKAPSGQSKNDAFYVKLGAIETAINNLETTGSANPDALRTLQFLTMSMSRMASSTTKLGAIDEDAKTELQLYMDNESRLDRQKQSILQNILRKMKSGRYDHNLAWKLWMYWVDEGAKAYTKEFGGDVKTMFPKQLRESLAKDYADDEKKKIEDGEYSHIKVAVEAEGPTVMPPEVQKAEDVAKGKVDNPYPADQSKNDALYFKAAAGVEGLPEEVAKLADQEIPVINEALATSVMTKVEGALNIVQASSKANKDLAKKDLHIISSKLAAVLQESELSDPKIRPNLLGLASLADKIQAHFAS